MKRVTFLCLVFVLLSPLIVAAQMKTVSENKNAVKLNTAALVLNNVSLLYERNLNNHWTVQAGAGYRWGGSIPKAFGLGSLIVTSNSKGLRGYSLTPEVRYYFNLCECGESPSGLYAGLYTRFTKLYGDLNFHYWNGTDFIDALVVSNFRELGGGLQIGYQLIFKERFLVDFMFAGPRISTNKIRFTLDSNDIEELVPIIEEEINKRLEWLGMDPISINPSPEIETTFGFRNFRYAIGIGFLF